MNCDHQVKPPSRQLYVENHRAHEVMLGCIQGNSGIIITASIWLAIAADPFGKCARKTANAPSAVIFSSEWCEIWFII